MRLAHGEEFLAELARQLLGLGLVVVGDGDDLAAHLLDVGPREAVGDRQRQHAVLAFHRLQLVDEAAHRLARGVEDADHAAVPGRHHRPGAALDGAFHHGEQVVGALGHVDMRVFLEQHQGGRRRAASVADVAMQVELDADRHVRTDDLADMGQEVAFAVVVALGHHGAVHGQEHAVDRQGGLQVGQ